MATKYQLVRMIKDHSVRNAVSRALADDGRLSVDEVRQIIRSTRDFDNVTIDEYEDIRRILRNSKTINSEASTLLRGFLDRLRDSYNRAVQKRKELKVPYKVDHIPSTLDRRPGTALSAKYLTIHGTANPNSRASGERGWLTNPENKRNASFHLVVDESEVIECIPLTEQAWHAGTSAGNQSSIGLEICESGDRAKTLQNAAALAAKILRDRNLGEADLRNHQNWSGKNCPRILLDASMRGAATQTWDWFKSEVKTLI